MPKQYDVRSRLNPRYLETGYECYYYGIYEVAEINARGKVEVVATYTGPDRDKAYRHAERLNQRNASP